MPSTYTVNLGIEKPATGEQSGTWGDTTNLNFDILDQAINGAISITLASAGTSGSPNTLAISDGATSDGRNKWIEFTDGGDLGATAFVQLTPNDAEKIVFIRNSLSGSRSVILFQGTYDAGRDLEVPAGVDMVVKFSGGGATATTTDLFTKLRATEITTPTLTTDDLTAGTADINDGTVEAVIGGTTPKAGTFTTLTATSYGGITEANLVDKSATETVSGAWTFSSTLTAASNIVVGGTVDGRDVATDGTKLDTIETSATADQTDAEIRTAVEAASDSNVFTDADHTKLNAIEASADVTDTTNVTAAGALMDSEVTNLAQVKAFDSSDYATAAQGTTADAALPKSGGAMTGAITTNSTFDGRDVATDGTKLDGIEASADVTDTANVTAAGALMDSELTAIASVKALNQGVATGDSPQFVGITSTANVIVGGNLTVNGTTTTLNTATLDVEDKNITINYGAGDTTGSANGAGITIQDAVDASTDATLLWDTTNDEFDFSHPINVAGTSVFASLDISGDIDVDGTTNLDAVDIDGNTDISGTLDVGGQLTGTDARFTDSDVSLELFETGAAANEGLWRFRANANALELLARNDANDDGSVPLQITRTGTVVDQIQLNATTLDFNGNVDTSGNVGIGTAPNSGSHTSWANLFMGTKGNLISSTGAGGIYGMLVTDNLYIPASTGSWAYRTANAASHYTQHGGEHSWYNAASGSADATATLTERMRIDSSGDITMGGAVDISGRTVKIENATDPRLIISDSTATTHEKAWAVRSDDSTFKISTLNDSDSAQANAISIERTGAVVDEIQLDATLVDINGAVDISSTIAAAGNVTVEKSVPVLVLDNSDNTSGDRSFVRFDSNTTARAYVGTGNLIAGGRDDLQFRVVNGGLYFSGNDAATTHFALSSAGVLTTPNLSASEVGYKGMPINSQAGDYTAVLTDAGKTIYKGSGGSGETFTIPANASVAYPIGTVIRVVNIGGGNLSLVVTTDNMYLLGAGSTGTRTIGNWGAAVLEKVEATNWVVSGVNLT